MMACRSSSWNSTGQIVTDRRTSGLLKERSVESAERLIAARSVTWSVCRPNKTEAFALGSSSPHLLPDAAVIRDGSRAESANASDL
jgi:hypothetical protein